MTNQPIKAKRGFALMSPEKRKIISTLGGINAHKKGVAHKWDSESARRAGKLGRKARAINFNKKIGNWD